ncbi:hypothetical protein [Singulisphaera acidiphila]|uniref:Uncharacterized protein n=1 Tax=Singulisphaera acidiphila (strain ATCC BAA-1392 / DSM 18658 / VKM B-2454 / MOB10) TaxID=886293 RepID=L0DAC9_SINAD|nr:hypothetical protein [Singulisphaera acidiphila]AGA26329.1 hypothetical protein Sinac_1973 [Singulisphaera acidiphila DSM 18658]
MNTQSEPLESTERAATAVMSPVGAEPSSPGGLASLVQDAESLQATLADAKARACRLIVALRRHRWRERLVNATLASLKALKLQDVAD